MLQVLTAVPTAATTEVEDVDDRALGVSELTIRERPPSTLRNVDDGPLEGAGAGGPGASTINAKKRRRRAHWRCRSWRSGSAAPAEPALRACSEWLQKPRDKCSNSS
jgi:hypothetical protein